MWFKNIQAYRFIRPFDLDTQALNEVLQQHAFQACAKQALNSSGWTAPLGRGSDEFIHAANDYIMICNKRQDKLLPAMVINEELEEKTVALEEKENRKLSRRERTALKEEIVFDLLPRAFVRSTLLYACISRRDNMLLINTSSEKRADEFIAELRKALGSLALTPLACKNPPVDAMTRWVSGQRTRVPFSIGGECELRYDTDVASTIRCKNQDLGSAEILSHLENGMQVSRLALSWDERIEFVLDEKLAVKRLRFTDLVQQQRETADDQATQFDLDFSLMTLELSALFNALISALGGVDSGADSGKDGPARDSAVAPPSVAPGQRKSEALASA